MIRLTSRLLAIALGATLVTGCAAPPSPLPSGSLSPTPSVTAAPTPSGPNVLPGLGGSQAPEPSGAIAPDADLAVTAAQAWGTLATVRLPGSVGSDRHLVLENAATPDGRYLICVDQPNAFVASVPTYRDLSYAVLDEVATGSLRRMAALARPQSQMLSVASDGTWVVWTEADDAPSFFDWRLRAYNLATGQVKEIARAATTQGGQPVQGPLSFVSVSHGLAVWGQTVSPGVDAGGMAAAVVREADLANGQISTLATSAGMPVLSWPWLAWGVSEGSGGFERVTNLETGFVRQLAITPPQFVLDGATAVYNDPQSLSMWLIDDLAANAPAVEIARGANLADHLEWPALNERIIGWTQSLSPIVYDRAEARLVLLPTPNDWSEVSVSGPLLTWEEWDPGSSLYRGWPDWLVVVNTNSLAVEP